MRDIERVWAEANPPKVGVSKSISDMDFTRSQRDNIQAAAKLDPDEYQRLTSGYPANPQPDG